MEGLFAICGLGPVCLYAIGGLIVLGVFIKVLVDRLNNEEDDYYSKNIHE
jgi:hypothetical protein